jgi:AraC family transcriptional activator of pobA
MSNQNLDIKPVSLPHPNKLLVIEQLDYDNPYDFHKPHRHDYFEIIMVSSGKGSQLIDFTAYDLEPGQLFAIYPGQVHLLQRETAQGIVIQFRKDIFEFIQPVKHHDLYFSNQSANPDPQTFGHLYDLACRIQVLLQTPDLNTLSIHKAYSYLQIILITLREHYQARNTHHGQPIIDQFLLLLTQHIKTHKKVAEYCGLLNCRLDKLSTACKTYLGKTPLELIHEELILEIRRMLLLNTMSLKEIAYELNFDSPANFSGFIKLRTGMTPSELQTSILKIYN